MQKIILPPKIPLRKINPSKLLLSKWTATHIVRREKHFLVVEIIKPDQPDSAPEWIELEAVLTQSRYRLRWQELRNTEDWLQGWK